MSVRAANRYAKALLELASESNSSDAVFKDMQLIAMSIADNAELSMMLESPIIKLSDKKAALIAIFGDKISDLSNKLIDLLAENKRMALLQIVAEQYALLYNKKKGIVKASVTTAFTIDDAMKSKILAKAKELAKGKEISLETLVDANIIGGFILRVGDVQIDASVLNKIGKLKRELKE